MARGGPVACTVLQRLLTTVCSGVTGLPDCSTSDSGASSSDDDKGCWLRPAARTTTGPWAAPGGHLGDQRRRQEGRAENAPAAASRAKCVIACVPLAAARCRGRPATPARGARPDIQLWRKATVSGSSNEAEPPFSSREPLAVLQFRACPATHVATWALRWPW